MKTYRCQRLNVLAAMALVECLVYIGLAMIVTGFAFTAFYRYWDHSRTLRSTENDMVQALHVGERWRADVRSASSRLILETNGLEQALRIPQATGEITYVFSLGKIWRLDPGQHQEPIALLSLKSSRMVEDPRSRVLAWRWEMELLAPRKMPRVQPLFTFLAVPAATPP